MALALRKARPDERQLLKELQRRASLMHDAYREQLLANPHVIQLPASHIAGTLVAELDGKIAGFAVVVEQGEEVELDGLFVEPALAKQGIGRMLVQRALANAGSAGVARMRVVASPESAGFYARCGFAVTGEVATQFGPAVVMVASLRRA